MNIETKYASIDRDELKRLQADANRYRWLRELYYAADFSYGASDGFSSIEAMVFKMPDGHVFTAGCDQTIDAAMLAAQGDSHE